MNIKNGYDGLDVQEKQNKRISVYKSTIGRNHAKWHLASVRYLLTIYATKIASPETFQSFHHSIQYQVDTQGDILQLAQSVEGSLW